MRIQDTKGNYVSVPAKAIRLAARELALKAMARKTDTPLGKPSDTADYLRDYFNTLEHEVFGALFLDTRNRIIAFEPLFRGTIDGASVHAREVVKTTLKHNASRVVFAHNHPSGVATPSGADERITQKLRRALDLIDVIVLDHIIIAGDDFCSFAEKGLL